MAKQIRAYILAPPFVVEVPREAKPLGVHFHNGGVYVVMEVDTDRLLERRTFSIVGVGSDLNEYAETYVGSVEIHENGGVYRLFVYEDKPLTEVLPA